MDDYRPWLQYPSASPACYRQETIFVPSRFCQVESADNAKGTVANNASLNFARGLLCSDENNP